MIKSVDDLKELLSGLKKDGKKIVFTNGCFDLIHAGHVDYLTKSKALGDLLIVGLNTDSSIKRIKDEKRPILKQDERALIISNLKPVDYVVFFDEDTPEKLISKLIPNVLVKGADWPMDKIVGSDVVIKNGGEVKTVKFITDQSTSAIIDLIIKRYTK